VPVPLRQVHHGTSHTGKGAMVLRIRGSIEYRVPIYLKEAKAGIAINECMRAIAAARGLPSVDTILMYSLTYSLTSSDRPRSII
jgi:hypothetical protein